MASELVGGALLKAALGELSKAVIDANKKSSFIFLPSLIPLEATVSSINPRSGQISQLNSQEIVELVEFLDDRKAFVLKCSKISTIKFVRIIRYSKKLDELNNILMRYFVSVHPIDRWTKNTVRRPLNTGGEYDKDNDEAIEKLSSSSGRSMIRVPVHSSRISPKEKFRQSSIGYWQKGKFLGNGSFGTVYEGYSDNGDFFAVKEVSLLDNGSEGQESILQLEQEISLLSQFEHENIIQYFGTAKDETRLYIFLELLAKGSLLSLYRSYALRDSQASSYTRQILNGLKYLHKRNVVHRDIKCANILIDTSGSVKLADFGLAKATISNDIKSSKGTAFWMAPEVVNSKENGYGLAADIWSLGCTVLEMLTGQHPYFNLEWMQALFSIADGVPPSVPDSKSLSLDARDFIYKCVQANPDNRPTAAQLLEHPFVKKSTANKLVDDVIFEIT